MTPADGTRAAPSTAADLAAATDRRLAAFAEGGEHCLDQFDVLTELRGDVADQAHRLVVALDVGGAEQARRIAAETRIACALARLDIGHPLEAIIATRAILDGTADQ